MKRRNILRLLGTIAITPVIIGITACGESAPEQEENHPVKPTGTYISLSPVTNGTVEISKKDNLVVGEKVTVTVKPNAGFYCKKVLHNGYDVVAKDTNIYEITIVDGANKIMAIIEEGEAPVIHDRSQYYVSEAVMNMGERRSNDPSIDDYYAPVRGLKGKALKDKLKEICQPVETFSYDHLRNSFPLTDQDPDEPGTMRLYYTGERYKGFNGKFTYINREHVWPNKRGAGTTGLGSDKHMQRPTEQGINNKRDNCDFGEVKHGTEFTGINAGNKLDHSQGQWGTFEPKDEFKGDTARIIFYCATLYSQCELDAADTLPGHYNSWTASNLHGDFDALYKWATDTTIDPIDKYEMHRNNQVDKLYQHNRNPFIDHPEFIQMIYDADYQGPGALK